VAENIARLGAVDDERVVEAARLAHAHEMILRLPQGYDTPLGDAGATLSGGPAPAYRASREPCTGRRG
jgi:ABC-type protease/lipase transport system fused ATPase/permease subunit